MRIAAAALIALWAAPAAADRIASAEYSGPTTRYDHGILGDAVEWTVLTVTMADGTTAAIRWDAPMVFEDTAPRIADLDGDGADEVIVVETHADLGARLAIWGVERGALVARATTPFIGQTHRWLAPAGWGDLDGDGMAEIAYVDRPHLAKTLRVFTYDRTGATATLTPRAEIAGLTNHRIGDPKISGGMRDCGTGTELILLSADWSRILSVALPDTTPRDLGPNTRANLQATLACR